MFRFKEEQRKLAIERYFPDIDWECEPFIAAMDAYPFECLNAVQRALKAELDSLRERERLIRNTERTMDGYMKGLNGDMLLDKSGKPIFIKGTATQLDMMVGKSGKLYEQIEKAQEKFMFQKQEEARIYGGRRKTASERGEL